MIVVCDFTNDSPELCRAVELAGEFYSQQLTSKEGEDARKLLHDFGVDNYGDFGWAPYAWDALHRMFSEHDVPERVGFRVGLLVAKDDGTGCYDKFRGRLVRPIRTMTGAIIALEALTLEEVGAPPFEKIEGDRPYLRVVK